MEIENILIFYEDSVVSPYLNFLDDSKKNFLMIFCKLLLMIENCTFYSSQKGFQLNNILNTTTHAVLFAS